MKKYGRSVLLVVLAASMLLYVVSRDSGVDGGLRPQDGDNLVTITLTKEEVQGILNKGEVQGILNEEEEESQVKPISVESKNEKRKKNKEIKFQKTINHFDEQVQYNDNDEKETRVKSNSVAPKYEKPKRKKGAKWKNTLNDEQKSVQFIDQAEPIENNTNTHSEKEPAPTSELESLLSKYKDTDFVVLNNKVVKKKDLNNTIGQEALKLAGLIKAVKAPWPPIMMPSGASLLRELDLSKYTAEDRSFLESRMSVYEERARHAGAACTSFPKDQLHVKRKTHFVWDTKHQPNIVFCPNYKVASTTWMMHFLRLAHFNENNPDIAKLRPEKREQARFTPRFGAKQGEVYKYFKEPSSPQEKLSVFKNALRVIIVRHPFTRILSAYRDKMAKMKPKPVEFKFRDLQLEIIAKYRKPNSDETSPHPTFAEFVQYVIDSTATLKTAKDWRTNVNCWNTYWSQCEVCSFDFNFIMKLETMSDDDRFLITLSDLKELKSNNLQWGHRMNASSTTSFDVAPEFYKQVTQKQMRNLYQRYKLDFDIYDYHIDDYIAIAKDA
ncbi:unnamed protein product [Meganyctiphanes norvegica]|uniref:Carbohydrate sulfotransferase n=1 Tax=Meganyctiphanes norvegica TaxID=48144 RepID=A0AAV2Q0L1_MEGNR